MFAITVITDQGRPQCCIGSRVTESSRRASIGKDVVGVGTGAETLETVLTLPSKVKIHISCDPEILLPSS